MSQDEHEVAHLNQLPDGEMRRVELEGTPILLFREGDAVHAVGATCPHAGGPLHEGVRHGARIVCPWHKATFCLRSGALLEPPAVDKLPRFRTRIDGGRVLLSFPAEEQPDNVPEISDKRCFVIVGAGAAGALAAQTLREEGFAGRIVMLDRENRVPYDRTILSKYYLSGEQGGEKSPLQKQEWYRRHRIERRMCEVVEVAPRERRITCSDGSTLTYDAALLATGGTPRRLPVPGSDLGNVFLLRCRSDAEAILAQAERSKRAVILGASFIGMEVAASLRERGLDVTVVSREKLPFAERLGERIGSVFVALHEKHGVDFRLGREIGALEGGPDVQDVVLKDGERLPANLVVAGFGIAPVTDYLRGVPLNEDGSVTVDAQLRVKDELYAAGDIARFPLYGDGDPIRVEHWRVAEQHGRVAALNMLGRGVSYEAVPVFWTIQYMKRLDYIGHASDWDEIVIRGDLNKPEFLAYYLKGGRVIAGAGFDRDQDMAALIELFAMRRDWTVDALGESPAKTLRDG